MTSVIFRFSKMSCSEVTEPLVLADEAVGMGEGRGGGRVVVLTSVFRL